MAEKKAEKTYASYMLSCSRISRRNLVKDVASVFRENAAASLLKIPGESSKKLRESFACKSACKCRHLDMQSFSGNPVGTVTILGADFS